MFCPGAWLCHGLTAQQGQAPVGVTGLMWHLLSQIPALACPQSMALGPWARWISSVRLGWLAGRVIHEHVWRHKQPHGASQELVGCVGTLQAESILAVQGPDVCVLIVMNFMSCILSVCQPVYPLPRAIGFCRDGGTPMLQSAKCPRWADSPAWHTW